MTLIGLHPLMKVITRMSVELDPIYRIVNCVLYDCFVKTGPFRRLSFLRLGRGQLRVCAWNLEVDHGL